MLIARSTQEAHLYMDLHACACGAESFERTHRLEQRDGAMVAVYEGACPQCGRMRTFEFRMTDELPPAPPAFGGPEPSRIIDPGEFMWVSDEVGTDASLRLLNTPPAEHRQHRAKWTYALAVLEEVFKFLPEDADRIPEELFTSDRGRAMYRKDPSRFDRRWLLDSLERKQGLLEGIDHFSPPQQQ
ncbi:hypothetical protein ABZ858_19125 [Streptomyces sp. NPDC047017]|uniref:hypothetical protein n=1 Tax=Streptomyces sp. NPDC047017 TaxID=3155024 RepID=UPI0033CE6A8E